MDLDDVKAGSRKERDPGVADLCDVYKFPKRKWVNIRLIPMGVFPTAKYWVKSKKKDGGETKFPLEVPSWDKKTQERDSDKYDPWRDYSDMEQQKLGKEGRDKARIQFSRENWTGAIIRAEQENQPRKLPKPTKSEAKTGFKDKESDSWTPLRAIKMGASFLSQVQDMKGLNIHKTKTEGKKAFAVNHAKYGCDIRVFYDPDKAPAEQYKVQIGECTPLTEEELEYLKPNLEKATDVKVPSDEETKAEFKSWLKRNGLKFVADDEDDDEEESKSKKKGKKSKSDDDDDDDAAPKAKKGKKKSKDEDFDEDDDDDDSSDDEDDDEDEEDEPKSKKSKKKGKGKADKKSKKKSKSDDDDDDFDEDDDDDDSSDDEDDEPKSKKKGKADKKKSKSDDDDDDDFDDDDDSSDDDDDEDEPKSKKKSKKKSEDDDDDFDEDEDEDEPKSKKSKKKSKSEDDDDDFDEDEDEDEPKSKKSKKKSKDEDDDDFDDDDGDDDEDEDEPKSKKKGKADKKSKKKSKSEDDDDDFDD